MLQVLQDLKGGQTELVEVPAPCMREGHLRIRTRRSLVSAGTERMLVEFGRANLIDKARQQPDKVRQVVDKVRTDGLIPTYEAVTSKLDQPLPLGYCNVGEVIGVGAGVTGFQVGDRVVSNGPHAEIVVAPQNLCARIPDGVADDAAAFTVLGAIALQGVRLLQPTLGERVVVMGLGLIGLIAVQVLRAHGCAVLGLDFDRARLARAQRFGAATHDLSRGGALEAAESFAHGRGVDGVLICASTDSDDPVQDAAQMCRKRGRIVLVGVVGLKLSRADFYEKELTFQVSCSYGPGRYDPLYEDQGQDYPFGYVRWTEQRNFEAILDLAAGGALDTDALVTHRFALADAPAAYAALLNEKSLGILLEYPTGGTAEPAVEVAVPPPAARPPLPGAPKVSCIGAGEFAGRILIPAFAKAGAAFRKVATAGGVSGSHVGRKYGFAASTTDAAAVLADAETDLVVVATRHGSHARQVVDALDSGKAVFVEKPLALSAAELDAVEAAYRRVARPFVMVGFNRRFAPHVRKMRALLTPGVRTILITVNAGRIPAGHWVHDPAAGGGRIAGEACHFVDLARHLADSAITGVDAAEMTTADADNQHDVAAATLRFADGSLAVIAYLANGHRSFPKERVEVFQAGRVLQLDNFRVLRGYGVPGFVRLKTFRQDKGHQACAQATLDALKAGQPAPIPFEELIEVSRATIAVRDAALAPKPAG
jgi:predicted dehydrogenase